MVLANNRRSGKSRGSASKLHEFLFQIFYQSNQYYKDTTLKNLGNFMVLPMKFRYQQSLQFLNIPYLCPLSQAFQGMLKYVI